MKLALLLLTASLGWAQVPTISNIVVSNVTHNSAVLRFTVNSNTAWVSYQLGTVSGTYTAQQGPNYETSDWQTCTTACTASFSITGLVASTTYYVRPTAQPNQTNQTNICNANGCGATEQTFTTSPDPPLPVVPTAPTTYAVPNPDTSAYTIVPIGAGTGGGECKATASIGVVISGDLFSAVLAEIASTTTGYVLELDQGITCPVPNTGTYKAGYSLPYRASGGSSYVVIRTKDVTGFDFPPFGTQMSPALCSKCATFKSTAQMNTLYVSGQVFVVDSTNGSTNIIIQKVILKVDDTISSGSWGDMVGLGWGSQCSSDNIGLDRVVIHGSSNVAVGTTAGVTLCGLRGFVANSWIDQIWSPALFAQGIFTGDGGTGPITIDNNHIECACMTIYEEKNNGTNPSANDVTITHNQLYWPAALINGNSFPVRQQVEFKGGHRVLIQGNLIDGCWAYQNECPAIFVSGITDWIPGDGVSDVNANYNLIRNAATVFDCMGVRPPDNVPGPMNNVNQRIWLQNTWAYNLGYANHHTPNSGGGQISAYVVNRPGCVDFTVDHNTFGIQDFRDTRAGMMYAFSPSIYTLGGGATYSPNFTHTNNVLYLGINTVLNDGGGGIFADNPQMNSSYPISPAIVPTTGSTYSWAQILNSYAIKTTNGQVTPVYTWSGNVNICGSITNSANTLTDMTSSDCNTWKTRMPTTGSGDTWATGNTVADREASVGFNPTTGICTGCGSAGANISTLYSTMGVVTGISASLSGTIATFAYTAPDTRACAVDTSPNGSTWTRQVDAGGSTTRTTTVTGLGATSSYRILCYFSQTAPLFSGSQITDGTFTAGAAFSPCDLNMDGVTNVMDVQLMVNMSLGTIPCTANITGPGLCTVVQVQRVVNASLSGACVTGP